jgi:hypothetical protein
MNPNAKRTFVILSLPLILFCTSPLEKPLDAAVEEESVLSASLRIDIDWHDYNPGGGNIVESGSCFLQVSGTIVKIDEKGRLYYKPKDLKAIYNYNNQGIDKNPPRGCPALYEETSGSGSVPLHPVSEARIAGGRVKDGVFQLEAFTGDVAKAFALQLMGTISPEALINIAKQPAVDIYMFGLEAVMSVTRRTRNTNPCSSYSSERFDMPIVLNLGGAELTARGMSGSYIWNSDRLESGVSLIDFRSMKKYAPEQKAGVVRYRASWSFKVPYVTIWRETDKGWTEITDNTENILIGEKLKLKADVKPSGAAGQWSVPGTLIKEFDGNTTPPKKSQPDLKGEIIEFAWVDGAFGGKEVEVKYSATAEGRPVSGSVTFKVFKPKIALEIDAAPKANLGLIGFGPNASDAAFELFLGPNNHNSGMHIAAKVEMPPEFAGSPYRVQYVQLVTADSWALETRGNSVQPIRDQIPKNSLDGQYPYPSTKDGEKTIMNDTPGGPFSLVMRKLYIQDRFQTYVMFIPTAGPGDGQGVWVPQKLVRWEWKGAAEGGDYSQYLNMPNNEANAKRSKIILSLPPQPATTDTAEYPNWTNVRPADTYAWKDAGPSVPDPNRWTPPGWSNRYTDPKQW